MPGDDRTLDHGFHTGELAVQHRAGVLGPAARLEGMLDPARLSDGVGRFLSGQTFAALTTRGRDGLLWTSPLVGEPGFLRVVDPVTLRIQAAPRLGDPLHGLASSQPAGLIVIDYERHRRFRLNGLLVADGRDDRLTVEVREAFGNCPQYLPQHVRTPSGRRPGEPGEAAVATEVDALTDADRAAITRADTFILGTTHPERGNDASHRGGPPGFVRINATTLWWPDYRGNNMFTSLGNLMVDDEAALLFLDLATLASLHLNGTAELADVAVGSPGDDGHTGRRVVFTTRHVSRTGPATV